MIEVNNRASYIATNENVIRAYDYNLLAIYYTLKAKNKNSLIYPDKEQAAKKLGISRSTLSAWLRTLVYHKLAIKRTSNHYVLLDLEELICRHNGGEMPMHKCTLVIGVKDGKNEIKDQLKLKLLEEKNRQVQYRISETEINQAMLRKYGQISTRSIREEKYVKVKSELSNEHVNMAVPMSALSLSKALGISERDWYRLSKRLKSTGKITSYKQQEDLGIKLSRSQYAKAKEHFGFATIQKRDGSIVRVKPNLVKCKVDYSSSASYNGQTPSHPPYKGLREVLPVMSLKAQDWSLSKVTFVMTELNGKKVPVPVQNDLWDSKVLCAGCLVK